MAGRGRREIQGTAQFYQFGQFGEQQRTICCGAKPSVAAKRQMVSQEAEEARKAEEAAAREALVVS